jgi:hypothetical protein
MYSKDGIFMNILRFCHESEHIDYLNFIQTVHFYKIFFLKISFFSKILKLISLDLYTINLFYFFAGCSRAVL